MENVMVIIPCNLRGKFSRKLEAPPMHSILLSTKPKLHNLYMRRYVRGKLVCRLFETTVEGYWMWGYFVFFIWAYRYVETLSTTAILAH